MKMTKPFILASLSPRRKALLDQVGLHAVVESCAVDETFDVKYSAEENAQTLAHRKAASVAAKHTDALILGADTIVALNGTFYGKPRDHADAMRMLATLSGKTHRVHTGFAIIDRPSGQTVTGVETTSVTFRELPEEEIREYVEGGSPMDKAGAYGIQDDYGAVFVTRVEGCYYNVVGLPLARVYVALRDLVV